MRETCLKMVHELARKDPRVWFIGSDLGIGTLDAMKRELPGRFLMEGVSEANLIGMAAGLAMDGKVPYLNTIATFLTRRCLDQIAIDLCLHELDVRLIASGGGVVYAPLGPTHEAVEDVALLRALPNMTILAPADADEMRRLMPLTLDHRGPIYIRLAKGHDPIVTRGDLPLSIGRAVPYRPGGDALLVSTGITLGVALAASEALAAEGLAAGVLHCPTLKPFDGEALLAAAAPVRAIVAIEEHTILGGLGSSVAEVIAEAGFVGQKRFRRVGIPDAFPDQYGSQASLMERYGITAARVAEQVRDLLAVPGARRV